MMAETDFNIYQKLVAVRKQITGIHKDAKTNFGDKFKYVSSNNILSMVRPLLDEQNLVLVVSVTGHDLIDKWRPEQAGVKPQNEHFTQLEIAFTWVNADKPDETIPCAFYGQGLDTGEKGVGKALTYAMKYFLLQFFQVPTDEDDPDGHGRPEQSERNGNGSRQRLEQPEDTVVAAQFRQDGTPANAEAERFAAQNAAFPDPTAVVDMTSFAECMTALGITDPEVVELAKHAAGLEQYGLDELDRDALRHIYAVSLQKTLQKRGAA
jgi:hypothetical protein